MFLKCSNGNFIIKNKIFLNCFQNNKYQNNIFFISKKMFRIFFKCFECMVTYIFVYKYLKV